MIFGSVEVIMCSINIVVVSGGVDYELDVMGPAVSGVWYFNLLPVVMMVRDGWIEHGEPWRHRKVTANHANIYFCFTWFRVGM